MGFIKCGNEILSYDLGDCVLNGIDIAIKQPNYLVKHGMDAFDTQIALLERLGIADLYDRRVVIGPAFSESIAKIDDLSLSGYDMLRTRCDGYDGVIIEIPDIPLISGWGDCPWLLVADGTKIGAVHATRDTLDKHILDKFFEYFNESSFEYSNLRMALSPYIPKEHFSHEWLGMKRLDEWHLSGAIMGSEGRYLLDLRKMIDYDINRLGLPAHAIQDAGLSSYAISERSQRVGGYTVSHRHSTDIGSAREGRGGFCIMLKH